MLEKIKILNTEFEPLRPIPHIAYDKFKNYLNRHAPLHYFFHLIYCRLMCRLILGYPKVPYAKFLEYSKNIESTQKQIDFLQVV